MESLVAILLRISFGYLDLVLNNYIVEYIATGILKKEIIRIKDINKSFINRIEDNLFI